LAVSSGNRTARRCARYTRLIGCSILYALPLVCVFFRPLNASKINEDATSINQSEQPTRRSMCADIVARGPGPPSWPHLALSPARARTKKRERFSLRRAFCLLAKKDSEFESFDFNWTNQNIPRFGRVIRASTPAARTRAHIHIKNEGRIRGCTVVVGFTTMHSCSSLQLLERRRDYRRNVQDSRLP